MDEKQMHISMGQAINIASDLILRNEFMQPRNKELSALELSARLKAAVPHIFAEIKAMQESALTTSKVVDSVEKQEPELELD